MSTVIRAPNSCKVYTPYKLARAMVAALHNNERQLWLEPGVGRGVFLSALAEAGVCRSNIVAIDLDKTNSPNDEKARTQRNKEFVYWASKTMEKFDCIVGNPPYISIRTLDDPIRSRMGRVLDLEGERIGVRANTWYAFILVSIRCLRPGGNLAFILPAAAEFADFCKPSRDAVTSKFDRVDLIRSNRPFFEDVQEGSIVLLCRGYGGKGGQFRRQEAVGLDGVVQRLRKLRQSSAKRCPRVSSVNCNSQVKLGDVLRIRLGGVTGDASYFVMSDSRRRELNLPTVAMSRVISKSVHIRNASINDSLWEKLRDRGGRVWLFRPSTKALDHKAVRRYLKMPVNRGGCHRDRYKVTIRDPWYRTPLSPHPDAYVSGMANAGPWLCFNECRQLNATNTLYVVHFKEQLTRAEKYAWALTLLTSETARQIKRTTRVYADGLRKIEPGDLARISIKPPPRISNAVSLYRVAIKSLLCGDVPGCRHIADEAIFNSNR